MEIKDILRTQVSVDGWTAIVSELGIAGWFVESYEGGLPQGGHLIGTATEGADWTEAHAIVDGRGWVIEDEPIEVDGILYSRLLPA